MEDTTTMNRNGILSLCLIGTMISLGTYYEFRVHNKAQTPPKNAPVSVSLEDISIGAVPIRVSALSSLRNAWDNELASWWVSGKPSLTPPGPSIPVSCAQDKRDVSHYPKGYYPLGCFIVETWERPMGSLNTQWDKVPLSLGEDTLVSLTSPKEEKGMVGATMTSYRTCKTCDMTPQQKHIVMSRHDWNTIQEMVKDIVSPSPKK